MAEKPGPCPRRRWGKTELSIPVIPFGTHGNSLGNLNIEQLEWNVAAVLAPPLADDVFEAFRRAGL